jgi:hypothetical protein
MDEFVQCQSGDYIDGKAVRCPKEATVATFIPNVERSIDVCDEHAEKLAHPVSTSRGGEVCPTCDGKLRVINAFDATEIDCPACVTPVCETCGTELDDDGRCSICWEAGL